MRIYEGCLEMYSEEKRNLHEMGTIVHPQTMQDKNVADDPRFRTLELSPAVFTILDGGDRDELLISLGKSLEWARADFKERTCGDRLNPGAAYLFRKDVWTEFLHEGKFSYTYAERFSMPLFGAGDPKWEKGRETAITKVLHELIERPDTRQAVLPIFNADRDLPNAGGVRRIPCSLHYQFLRRADELRMMYVMRSCDFFEHFPYDIWMALELQSFFARIIGVRPGRFTFFSGSLHIYAKNADQGVF